MVSALSLSRAFAIALALGLTFLEGPAGAQTRAAPAASTAAQIDLNSASQSDLMALDGIGEVRADAIIRARPFKAKTELVERRIIPEALYDKIADKLTARAVPVTPPVAPKR
jgi:DNA uptake protein ComE-like DNA-binding protein